MRRYVLCGGVAVCCSKGKMSPSVYFFNQFNIMNYAN
jgi:hypothetical protein